MLSSFIPLISFTVAVYYAAQSVGIRLSQLELCDVYGVSSADFKRILGDFIRFCGALVREPANKRKMVESGESNAKTNTKRRKAEEKEAE